MPIQFTTVNLVPAGIGRYTGADAVVKLTDAPSDAGSGGIPLPGDKRLTASDDMRSAKNVDLYVTGGGTCTVTYDGTAPTASYGFPLDAFESMRNITNSDLAAMRIFVPSGSTLHARYFWGSL